jgi:RimJ/RimL family protein N-acetyltransferase
MASLTDISLRHGRAELIIGVRGAAPGLALEASLLLLEFAFRTLRLRKLHSTVYGGNEYALRSTRHLGFELEGRLRQHVQDPRTRECLDLCLFGLLPQEFFSAGNQRLAARLLGRPLQQ